MKIWGPRSGSTQADRHLATEGRNNNQASGVGDDVPPPPMPFPGVSLRAARGQQQQQQAVSDGALRFVARVRRESPVDLRLDSESLRSASDVLAVFDACALAGAGDSIKTLVFGPWGNDPCCHGHGSNDNNNNSYGRSPVLFAKGFMDAAGGDGCESADCVLLAFASVAPTTWSAWPLRGFTVCELRLVDVEALASVLQWVPDSVRVLRMQ
ncbi:unnamed protein product, partial [Polarella glacialis]